MNKNKIMIYLFLKDELLKQWALVLYTRRKQQYTGRFKWCNYAKKKKKHAVETHDGA